MGAYENNGTLTPVELVAFTAFDNTLCWSTLSESNNLGFYIETAKAASGPFSTIGFVEGAGTTTEPQNYSFPFKSEISQQLYRLKQIDFDGSFAYSSVIQVGAMPTNFNLLQNSPNPFSVPNQTTIELQLPEEQRVTLHVYDILGKHVKTLCDRIMPAGISRVYWDGQNAQGRTVSAGTYLYVLNNGKHKLCKSLTVF